MTLKDMWIVFRWIFAAIVIAVAIGLMLEPAMTENVDETAKLRDALERIALLDEADGHELTWEHASRAVAIATSTLGKHPSEILADRQKAMR